jgi:hypothetical protein
MLPNLPAYITIVFILTVILTIYFLFKASWSITPIIVAIVWLSIQGILSYNGFYLNSEGTVSEIAVALLPPLVFIILVLSTKRGKKFIRRLDLRTIHLLHIVRIPVELCLYWLSLRKAVPELMTFAGENLDIITGITAPILYFTCFKRRAVRSVNLLFGWNIIGLVLLGSAVVKGILSAPTAYQKLAFDDPNIAILYFPFIWLPSFIVMVLLFSHLVMIKRLMER